MKRTLRVLLSAWIIVGAILAACSSGGGLDSGKCQNGVCLMLRFDEPVELDKPTQVIATITSERDIQGLEIVFALGDPRIIVEEPHEVGHGDETYLQWVRKWVDVTAGQPVEVTANLRFTAMKSFGVIVTVHTPEAWNIPDESQRVWIEEHITAYFPGPGPLATIDPEGPLEGAGILVTRAPTPGPSPTPEPTPYPIWDRDLPRLEPGNVLTACGWTKGEAPLTEWEAQGDTKIWIEVPAPVPLDAPAQVRVGIEFPENQKEFLAEMALCLTDTATGLPFDYSVEGESRWQFTARPGEIIWSDIVLRFHREGEVAVRVGAYSAASGQVMSAGQLTWVEPQETQIVQSAAWITITTQNFEGVFPPASWRVEDLSGDGYERYWDDNNYRAYASNWAGWPANGGADKIEPTSGNDNYPNRMDARMIYGPFDLSDAAVAGVSFYLRYQIEANYDYLVVEASHDGVTFSERHRWTGTHPALDVWTRYDVDLSQDVGDDSVWVAWRFFSDASVTYDGPWVDDIKLRKYVPGQVQVSGSLGYYARNGLWAAAPATLVELREDDGDPGPSVEDDLVATTGTNASGLFDFGAWQNWDADVYNPDLNARRLDLYLVAKTLYFDSSTSRRVVSNYQSASPREYPYEFESDTQENVPGPVVNLSADIASIDPNLGAMWIFQDARRAWEYLSQHGSDPGDAIIRWEPAEGPGTPYFFNSFFYPAVLPGVNRVPHVHIVTGQEIHEDIVIHELGHQYMSNAMGFWFWNPANWDDFYQCAIIGHDVYMPRTPLCAWTEGWGNFLPLAINGDPIYSNQNDNYDLEAGNWQDGHPFGDNVEGRVAGALYDLFDSANEGHDRATFGFGPLWGIAGDNQDEWSLGDFWNAWKSIGYNKHLTVQAIYQNTIDYNHLPILGGSFPVREGLPVDVHLDLWNLVRDEESEDGELILRKTGTSTDTCNVSLNGHDLHIVCPAAFGWCEITVEADDGIGTSQGIIQLVKVSHQAYLPMLSVGTFSGKVQVNPYPPPGETTSIPTSSPYP